MEFKTCKVHKKSIVVFQEGDCPLCKAEGTLEPIEITPSSRAPNVLSVLAYFDLFVSIIAAVIILTQFGTTSEFMNVSRINPIGVGIGLAVLFQGIFGWALLLVIASMAKDLSSIRRRRL